MEGVVMWDMGGGGMKVGGIPGGATADRMMFITIAGF